VQKTTVYLPDDLKRRVEETAEQRGISEAEVIRDALREYTLHPKPRAPLFSAEPIVDYDEALEGFGE
jgi:metal-responsive CopG/Arc/MetJ family transcriptional regulator